MKKKILVTGGLGYLGGRISEFLVKNEKYYIIIGSRNSIINLPSAIEKSIVSNIDLLDVNNLKKLTSECSIVIHLAGMNAHECNQSLDKAIEINGHGTRNLIKASIENNVEKFIFFSSAHIYGNLEGDIDENTVPNPISNYAISNFFAEKQIINETNNSNIKSYIMRLSNVIGRPLTNNTSCWDLVSNDFAKQIVENKTLVINSCGSQHRDFVPIENVLATVNWIINEKKLEVNPFIFNLGLGQSLSILDLAKIFANKAKEILDLNISVNTLEKTSLNFKKLIYSNKKLKLLNIPVINNLDQEIEQLLIFADREFND